jgi:environmental stress-induced protein Ves
MRHLKAGGHRVMPWKNGLGSTTEIAVFPPGASVEDFGWRVSAADVAASGPFSGFPGIDRTLSILDGDGLTLFVGNAPGQSLTKDSAPFAFPADVPTSADLLGGPITDLNVMTRRGVFRHSVERLVVDGERVVTAIAGVMLFYCQAGDVRVLCASGEATLAARDAVLLDPGTCRLTGRASLFMIALTPAMA